ncbi:MAG TPA: DUF5317 domain-containing protein [Tissierellaceae bacterium]|nr:DUF5317 domain-containing protein [Tissierellaceae bacterium]
MLEAIIISILVAKLRKGRLENLEKVGFKGRYLLLMAAATQLTMSLFKKIGFNIEGSGIINWFFLFHFMSYVLILVAITLNIEKRSMKLFLIGVILNFLVIFANGGKMPVSIEGIKGINKRDSIELLISDFDIKHKSIDENTRLIYLADIILIPKPYPLPKVLSVGDLFLMGGFFLFMQEGMINKDEKCKA